MASGPSQPKRPAFQRFGLTSRQRSSPAQARLTCFDYLTLRRSQQLRESLSLNVTASFKGITGSVDARLDFARSSLVTRYQACLSISMTILNEIEQLEQPRLTAEALNRLKNGGLPDFYRSYGNEFVAGLNKGGELIVLVTFESSSQEELEELRIAVNGTVGGFSSSAEFAHRIEKLRTFSTKRVVVYRDGGANEFKDLDSMLKFALEDFPLGVKKGSGPRVIHDQQLQRN